MQTKKINQEIEAFTVRLQIKLRYSDCWLYTSWIVMMMTWWQIFIFEDFLLTLPRLIRTHSYIMTTLIVVAT